jgi:hypothetical protein
MNREAFERVLDKHLPNAREIVANRVKFMPLPLLRNAVLTRFDLGETRYGPLDLLDGRDWLEQETEEIVDAVCYRVFSAALDES